MTHATAVPKASSSDDAVFTREDFVDISGYALKHFGLNLSESKIPLITSRLTKRLQALNLNDFTAYREVLHSETDGAERTALLSALTTNVTHFFREVHHFEYLKSTILPDLLMRAKQGQRVRFWSAGCSTGQEAYSIAMTVLEHCPEAATYDLKILATDIDPVVVETAKVGIYADDDLTPVPAKVLQTYAAALGKGRSSIDDTVRSLIAFGTLNLIEPLPFAGPFDVIFCRNVAIYFDRPTQQAVWQQLTRVLGPQGHLFIGHSERISGPAEALLQNVGITTYRRNA